MKVSYLFGLMLAASFAFTGCGDDDDSGANPGGNNQTKTQLITAKNYKLTGMTIQGQNVFNDFVDDCQKDDHLKFNTNMTYTITDLGDTCGTAETGTWVFFNNEASLRMISTAGDTVQGQIMQLDGSTLKVKETDALFGEIVVTYTGQ